MRGTSGCLRGALLCPVSASFAGQELNKILWPEESWKDEARELDVNSLRYLLSPPNAGSLWPQADLTQP